MATRKLKYFDALLQNDTDDGNEESEPISNFTHVPLKRKEGEVNYPDTRDQLAYIKSFELNKGCSITCQMIIY